MKHILSELARWTLLLVVAALGGAACGGTPQAIPAPTATPTELPPQSADLKALETVVERHRQDQITNVPKDGGPVDILENDRIAIADKGWGELRYEDRLIIDLHHDTQLDINDIRLDPIEDSIFLRLRQIVGSTRVELTERARSRIEIDTDHATLTSATQPDSATVFVVCHAPKVTCMVTVKGEVDVEAQGESVAVLAGMGTYIFPGQPPSPPICIDLDEFNSWLEDEQRAQADRPLGALVQEWDENDPCRTPIEPTATPMLLPQPMVQIPVGRYEVGYQEADEFHLSATQVELGSFWIDVFEVTNAHYEAFVNYTGHPAPTGWQGGAYQAGRENHPVKGVTWDDASAYCSWVQRRLPTEAEWEVAARGADSPPPLFPWGNDAFAGGALDSLPREDTYQVGSAPFNRSPFGVHDLAVNVWEWVGEPYGPIEDGSRLLRGGRHGFLRDMAYRQQATPDDPRFVEFAGFRCAADQGEGE